MTENIVDYKQQQQKKEKKLRYLIIGPPREISVQAAGKI